jgi:NADPH:quinone reductase-like Zn-dependent oxidoreductase
MRAMAQRAWTAGTALTPVELPDPVPGPLEIRVRVRAAGVNPVDWKMRTRGPLRLAARLIGPPLPFIPGIDFAGVIDAVGRHVGGLSVGDAVVGGTDFSRGQRGSAADTVIVRPDQVCALPPGFDLDVAGALPVAGVTAWMSVVEIGRLKPGQSALVLGASGGVGQLCVQLVRLLGGRAVGVCSTRNLDLVRALGADAVLDYTSGDPLAAARPHGPFQLVVDCAGGYSGAACRRLLARGGRHVMVAGDSLRAQLNLLMPPFTSRSVLARTTTARLRPLVDAIAAGQLTVAISARLPLTSLEEAHTLSRSGRLTGKIVVNP